MSQKICVISFDHWNYDKHIVTALQKKGIDAFHIKIGGFKHKNIFAKINNTFSKVFLGKNPKIQKRQEFIIKTLEEKGIQDQILVINPELIELDYHIKIKAFTKKYNCYLYDSIARCPVEHLLDGIFDDIYSFDKNDIKKYGFKETSNYFYIEAEKIAYHKIVRDMIYIGSIDERIAKVNDLGKSLQKQGIRFQLYGIGKKATVYRLKQFFGGKYKHITFQRKTFTQEETLDLYRSSKIILDIIRQNQTGLSFRIFEAMPFEKKIITNNANVLAYNFYNPNNILILDQELDFKNPFFETNYDPLPEAVYHRYSLDYWTNQVFNLD